MWWYGSITHSPIWFSSIFLFIVIECGPLTFFLHSPDVRTRIDHFRICSLCARANGPKAELKRQSIFATSVTAVSDEQLPEVPKVSTSSYLNFFCCMWEMSIPEVEGCGYDSLNGTCDHLYMSVLPYVWQTVVLQYVSIFHNFCDCNRLIVNYIPWHSLSLYTRASWCYI